MAVKCIAISVAILLAMFRASGAPAADVPTTSAAPIRMSELAKTPPEAVEVVEVSDYVFGNYAGDLPSPPHADGNPKRAFIVRWKDQPYRLVFGHEGSYCPWFEFPSSGAGACWQFFEGNDGWAELFNEQGRKEKNSFIEIVRNSPGLVELRWTYFGVNMQSGKRAYRAIEHFFAYPSGLVLRKQSYTSLMPGDHRGYAREPIEMIGMCPVGKRWKDVLRSFDAPSALHSLCMLDAFSDARFDMSWTPKPDTLWDSVQSAHGDSWKEIDDARGVAMVLPLKDGLPFCILGDASGFDATSNRLKNHSFVETGGIGWGSMSWDHWPIGWLNSQAHEMDGDSLKKYPNHFSPMGLDLFALPNEEVENRAFLSLYGVGSDFEPIRALAKQWLAQVDIEDASKLRWP